MRNETHAGVEARDRQDEATSENADDAPPTLDRLPARADLPCGASVPHEDGDDLEELCADGSPCEFGATYVVTRSDGTEVAVCGNHLPEHDPTTCERAAADGGNTMPADPFDRSPEDYDVSDHPAAVDHGDGPCTDGGTISSDARVECSNCDAEATGFDERAGVHLCDDCDSAAAVTDHEAVVRAVSLVESDARFILLCFDCRRSTSFIEDTEAVERARDPDRLLECECGGEYELVIDAASDSGIRHTDPSVAADLEDGVPRCRKCGEVIVVRSGPAYERCVECLLDEFGAAEADR